MAPAQTLTATTATSTTASSSSSTKPEGATAESSLNHNGTHHVSSSSLATPSSSSSSSGTAAVDAGGLDLPLDYHLWAGPYATPLTRDRFVHQLRDKVLGLGFFYLANSPLEGVRRSRMFELVERLFALPLEERMSVDIDLSRHFRGYSKFGDERTQYQTDHRDQIDYATEAPPFPPSLTSLYPFLHLHGPNQYLPDTVLPGHREVVQDWYDACTALSHELTCAIERALGLPEGALTAYVSGPVTHPYPSSSSPSSYTPPSRSSSSSNGAPAAAPAPASKAQLLPIPGVEEGTALPYARMKTVRYPVGEAVDGIKRLEGSTQGVGAHRDGGWLTLLATGEVAGLQVEDLDGTWLDVPHLPGSIVVNFGQQFEVISHGLVRAATHRVVTPTSSSPSTSTSPSGSGGAKNRYSVPYFSMPALNVLMHPLDIEAFSPAIRHAHAEAQAARRRAGKAPEGTSVVQSRDLHAPEEAFGIIAWRGIYRSHPGVVERWHKDAKAI